MHCYYVRKASGADSEPTVGVNRPTMYILPDVDFFGRGIF